MRNLQLGLIWLLALGLLACNKEDFTNSPEVKLTFSTDTISFDTIFTALGSTTQRFVVKNEANATVNVSQIRLAGGDNSPFRLNINGLASINESDIELQGNDSIYIFVEVTIDPNGENLPMVVNDSIVFVTNGNYQTVKLIAFGQDVHLINGEVISSQHWENDKPYLVYNYLILDSLETLTIDPGCRIYFHNRSSLFVKGTLNVNGTYEKPVSFLGDRLEEEYGNFTSQWGYYTELEDGSTYIFGGIHFLVGSKDNTIDYAVIKNSIKGIRLDSMGFSANPVLTLSNTRIENMSSNCIDARSSYLKASNCIFANSGSYALALLLGGIYDFYHCTVANYYEWDIQTDPSVILNNYYEYDDVIYSYNLERTNFSNCIIYGQISDELVLDNYGGGSFSYNFTNCLIKSNTYTSDDKGFVSSIFNTDPEFVDPGEYNFAIDSVSPAKNIGNVEIAKLYPLDLNNNSRLADEGPDLGALEWISEK